MSRHRTPSPADVLRRVEAAVATGRPPDPHGALAAHHPALARAVTLATDVGAPLGPVLAAARAAADDRAELARTVRVATAQARVVAGGLVALPLVLVPLLAGMLGIDLVGFAATGAGRAVLMLAGGLLALGTGGLVVLVRRAGRPEPTAGADELADLAAAGLSAGLPPGAALRAAGAVLPALAPRAARLALALEHGTPPPADDVLAPVAAALLDTVAVGAPAAPALTRVAAELRAAARTRALERAERLPALLTFPTALCLLPAVVLLVGAPVVVEALGGLDLAGG
ncbi:MAG: type II secretion system F family protein [Actinomycetes bacterium]